MAHQQPHSAGGRMHHHDIARFDRVAGIQQKLRGQTLQHEGGGRIEVDPIRYFHQAIGGYGAARAIGAGRQHVGHAISNLEVCDAFAQRIDDSRRFAARNQRRRRPGINAFAKVRVDEIHADRLLQDAHFSGAGCCRRQHGPLQGLGATRRSHHDSEIRVFCRHSYLTNVPTKRRMRTTAWLKVASSAAKHSRTNPRVSAPKAPPSITESRSEL